MSALMDPPPYLTIDWCDSKSYESNESNEHHDSTPSSPPSTTTGVSHPPSLQTAVEMTPTADDPMFTPRQYQLELFRRACNENIIACLETGAGKTLIAALLVKHVLESVSPPTSLHSDASTLDTCTPLRNLTLSNSTAETCQNSLTQSSLESSSSPQQSSSSSIVVFLVHRIPLVIQQANVLKSYLPSRFLVECYHGDKGVDSWSPERWAANIERNSVFVMTAQIFLNILRHGLISMEQLDLIVVDEAHHATKSHPYRRVFVEFFHSLPPEARRPRVFGMTATPVKAKSASSKHAACLKAVIELEATMDATVVTVSTEGQNEVESLVPSPKEYVLLYTPSQARDDEVDYTLLEDDLDHQVLVSVINRLARDANAPHKSAPVANTNLKSGLVCNAEMKVLTRLNSRLGFIAASDVAYQFCNHRSIRPEGTISALWDQCSEFDVVLGGVRDGVDKTLDLLFSEYMRCLNETSQQAEGPSASTNEAFRAIVFVHERITAFALSKLINDAFRSLNRTELIACPMVGAAGQLSSLQGMSTTRMSDALENFRRGNFGILVATNVVEEGIDVPACRLVVAFDPALSPTAYVQGRGRARRKGGRYVVLLADGIDSDVYALQVSRQGRRVMTDITRGSYASEDERRLIRAMFITDTNDEKTLFSRTTNARVSATEAVNLLTRYVQWTLQFSGNIEDPRYEVHEDKRMFTAIVYLDPRLPLEAGICSEPQVSDTLAKRLAALDAYRKLYISGEISEYLLPLKHEATKRVVVEYGSKAQSSAHGIALNGKKKSRKSSRPPVEPKAAKKHKRMRRCDISHPFAPLKEVQNLSSTDIAANTGDVMMSDEVSVGCFENIENEKCVVKEMVDVEQTMYMYTVRVDKDLTAWKWYAPETTITYGILLRYQLAEEDMCALQCPSGDKLITLTLCREVSWCDDDDERAEKFVRALQICMRGKAPGSVAALQLEENLQTLKYTTPVFYLLPLAESLLHGYVVDWLRIEKLFTFGWKCGPALQEDMLLPSEMEYLVVCSSHESQERVYFSGSLNDSVQAKSSCENRFSEEYATFVEYYETKHDIEIKDQDQHLLPGFSLRETVSGKETHEFMLVPELLRIVPLDVYACYLTCLLPSWQTFLALRTCWHRNGIKPIDFLKFARALQPNINNLCVGNSDYCYERDEFLGDSVLKVINSMVKFANNPDVSEGDLSDERDIAVSNGNLADAALQMKLHDCVAYSGLAGKAKSWPWHWGSYERKSLHVSEKVLADCVEALIGAHFQHGGFEAAVVFMDRHRLLPGACEILNIADNVDGNPHDRGGVKMIIPAMIEDDMRHESQFVKDVENIIGYEFRDKRHLVIALTHGSYNHGRCISYQKYEYLGDAIIGFLLLSHFFKKYPHLGPGELTKLRGPALSNDLFARVIASLDIHQRFWYDCEPLKEEIQKCVLVIANDEDDEDDVCKKMTVPKVLGDLLESILGAIVVDQGMRLDVVRDVAIRLVQTEIDRFANPTNFKQDPVSSLLLEVQRHFHSYPVYKFLDEGEDKVKRCNTVINGEVYGCGTGRTRRIARRNATVEALGRMYTETGRDPQAHIGKMMMRKSHVRT